MNSLKEKMVDTLGAFGMILYYIIHIAICILPFIMIDLNFVLTFILICIDSFFPLATIVFWVWGLIKAIQGPQDIIAIIYYIAFAVLWLPFFISILTSLFRKD